MNTNSNPNKKRLGKIKNSVSLKLFLIVSLSLLMLIPTIFIRNLIHERQYRRDDTIREVTSKWGEAQQLFGPVLIVPYLKKDYHTNGKYSWEKDYYHIMPSDLSITGGVSTTLKHRGIYDVTLYDSELLLEGNFKEDVFRDLPANPEKMLWTEARLLLGISDINGLGAINDFRWNDTSPVAEGGIPYPSSVNSGINAKINVKTDSVNSFQFSITMNGSESIFFVPAGKSTKVEITSPWPDPSFNGASLPNHNISDTGFSATWQVMDIKRGFPQQWSGSSYHTEIANSAFGVDLIIPVDIYHKSERSVKYALLFIGLTFLVIFFIEMISKHKIHPVQYLLTGAALVVFYSLLLALSEHISFSLAYLLSSAGIVGLITFHAHSIFNARKYVLITGLVLVALYGFLYAILQMQDMALLVGNIGLFIIIALVMLFSRKIKWYSDDN